MNAKLQNGVCLPRTAVYSFRVLVIRANGSQALFRLENTLPAAVKAARLACDRHLAKLRANRLAIVLDNKRPRMVYVQAWQGTAQEGRWIDVPQSRGGYEFTFLDDAPQRFFSRNPKRS